MDATVHMVPDHDELIVTAEKKSRYMWTMRLALVYAEIKNAKSTIRSAVRSQNGFWSDGQQKGEQQQSMYERAPRSQVGFLRA